MRWREVAVDQGKRRQDLTKRKHETIIGWEPRTVTVNPRM